MSRGRISRLDAYWLDVRPGVRKPLTISAVAAADPLPPQWVESGGSGNADGIHNGSEHPDLPAMLAGDATAQAVARQGSITVARSIAGVAERFRPRCQACARWTTCIAGQGTLEKAPARRLQKDQADPRRAGDIGIAGSCRPNERCRFVIRISLPTKRISGGASDGISSRRPPSGSLRSAVCCAHAGSAKIPTMAPAIRCRRGTSTKAVSTART